MARVKAAAASLLTVLFVMFGTASAWADFGKRYALVVGNSAYAHVEPLPNTARDAAAMAAALEALRFNVFKGIDLTGEQFNHLLDEFTAAAADADTVVLYYAGHGFQLNGLNHLAPVDAVLRDRSRIGAETFVLNDIIERVHHRNRQTIVFLDACRNNPLPPGVENGSSDGLAQLETGDGTFIAFATQPGNVSYDGTGKNSPFTEALLTHIGKPGRSISDLMIEVRNDVSDRTLLRQVPWDQSSLRAQFYFNPSPDYIALNTPAKGSGLVIGPPVQSPARSSDDGAADRTPQRATSPIIIGPGPERPGAVTAPPIKRLEPAREYFVEDAVPAPEGAPAATSERSEPTPQRATAAPIERLKPAIEMFVEEEAAPSSEDTVAGTVAGTVASGAEPDEAAPTEAAVGDSDAGGEQRLAALAPQEQALPEARPEPEEPLLEEDELIRRIQSHLARLGCYRMAVDGAWGPGSRGGLEQFYRKTGKPVSSLDPSLDVLLMLEDESGTICPPPAPRAPQVAAPTPPKTPAAPRTQQRTQRTQQQQRPAAAAQPSQPASSSTPPRIIGF